jgi:hypothetical protein
MLTYSVTLETPSWHTLRRVRYGLCLRSSVGRKFILTQTLDWCYPNVSGILLLVISQQIAAYSNKLKQFSFDIVTPERTYKFFTNTFEEYSAW